MAVHGRIGSHSDRINCLAKALCALQPILSLGWHFFLVMRNWRRGSRHVLATEGVQVTLWVSEGRSQDAASFYVQQLSEPRLWSGKNSELLTFTFVVSVPCSLTWKKKTCCHRHGGRLVHLIMLHLFRLDRNCAVPWLWCARCFSKYHGSFRIFQGGCRGCV